MRPAPRPLRAALLLPGAAALLGGLAAGLARLGHLPPAAGLASAHGPLMVAGFLGTVISLERAVALGRPWGWTVPARADVGPVAPRAGALPLAAAAAVLAGVGLVALFATLARREPALHMGVMAAGAGAWLAGDLAWATGTPLATVVGWWVGFLVLTIVGERMELNRVQGLGAGARALVVGLVAFTLAALALAHARPEPGARALGLALVLLALWLLRFDIARRTIRARGLTRYVAACLLSGYAWLAVGGALLAAHGPTLAGPVHDAWLHAVFVGFVLSMIMGHAPVVFPAVLGLRLPWSPALYLPLALLHASLLARLLGDLVPHGGLRAAGAGLNVVAVLLFALTMVSTALRARLATRHPAVGGPP